MSSSLSAVERLRLESMRIERGKIAILCHRRRTLQICLERGELSCADLDLRLRIFLRRFGQV